ncbi:MAG: [ribosomal protein S5]-alanine N-acetyltransferase [Clostridiales bacterium]|nr:[ribosomal protein S5]-alanine N-acetyltransferase [Clostridiales bacterium]
MISRSEKGDNMNLEYQTKHLDLRILTASYAKAVCQFYQKNRLAFEEVEPTRVPNFYTEEFHASNLSAEYNEFLHGRYLRLFLFEKDAPTQIIGSICFNSFRSGCFMSCIVGYKMDGDYTNKGYMSEALSYSIHQIIKYEYNMHRIEAMVLPSNKASIRILEKLGFQNEGIAREYAHLNGVWRDHFRYSMLVYQ